MFNRFRFSLSLIVLFISILASHGQSLMRSSLSCLGSTGTSGGLLIQQTIGQPSNTYIFTNEGLVLQQGFLQPPLLVVEPSLITVDFDIYPNPAYEKVRLELKEPLLSFTILINNMNGSLLKVIPNQTLSTVWLDLGEFFPGTYIISIISNDYMGSKNLIIYR